MAVSQDVRKRDGKHGPLAGKTPEQIYRAHHNLDPATGELLPGFTEHLADGCECDHCAEYLARGKKKADKESAA
jgi:hypothetical protein